MKALKLSIVTLTAVLFLGLVSAQYTVSSLVLTVYEDGYVRVTYQLIPDDYVSQISVHLLGEHIEDVIVEDEDGNPLNYQLNGNELTVFVGSASIVNVTYYTPDLTAKRGILWTLNVSTVEPFTVVLPENAVIVDLTDIPLRIAGNRITMPPGNQSVSYTIEWNAENNEGGSRGDGEVATGIAALGIVLVAGAIYVTIKRRSKTPPTREEFTAKLEKLDLKDEEKRALLYLFDKGGRASQGEVREAVGLPKTTAWRMFRRLERMGLVRILKGKKENWVELKF